jgi:hypothetical protein
MKILGTLKTVDAVSFTEVLKSQARVALAQKDTDVGCAAAEQVLTLAKQKFGDDTLRSTQAQVVHGECLAQQGHMADARAELRDSVERLSALTGAQSPGAHEARMALQKLAPAH